MKKEKLNYFEEFIKITKYVDDSTKILTDLMKNYSVKKLDSVNKEIHTLENSSDAIVHKVRRYLITDFLPPIDREDIGLLLHKLDDIEDGLDELSKNFQILNVGKMREFGLERYIHLLTKASTLLEELFSELKNQKNKEKIVEQTIKIGVLEEEADHCFEECITNLYKYEKDPIEIIKWTKIYNGFEYLFDTYENTSDTIEDIIIKNS